MRQGGRVALKLDKDPLSIFPLGASQGTESFPDWPGETFGGALAIAGTAVVGSIFQYDHLRFSSVSIFTP
jgi:hypothetical protein